MKLKTVIKKLEKLNKEYFDKHGFDPVVNEIEDEGFNGLYIIGLCKKTQENKHTTTSMPPYMEKRIKMSVN